MTTIFFPAILERGDEGFGVFFPDLPGCVSAGKTAQEAAEMASEALSLHLVGMAEDNEAIPEPSQIDAIEKDADVNEVGRLLVGAELPGRKVRINITLDEGLIKAIDTISKNRSGFLADAARIALSART